MPRKFDKRLCKTRKRRRTNHTMNTNDIEDEFHYDIDTICTYIQTGSGLTRRGLTKSRHRTNELINHLVRLGWDTNYLKTKFHYMNDTIIRNWPDNLLLEAILKKIISQSGFHNIIYESLLNIGLVPNKSREIEAVVVSLWESSYTDTQILDICIEYLLGFYTPITPDNVPYCIEQNSIDSWVPITHDNKTLKIYNMSLSCRNTEDVFTHFNVALLSNRFNADSKLFFHTTSWGGSLNIIDKINRALGRKCLDFGVFPGFYLSENIKDCIEWGTKKKNVFHNEVAILVFSIPNTIPQGISIKLLEGDTWTNVTKESRRCTQQQNEIKAIRDYDLLYGNMVNNPTQVKNGREPLTHTPPRKQLVGRTDTAEKFLHICLVGCVYFCKNRSA